MANKTPKNTQPLKEVLSDDLFLINNGNYRLKYKYINPYIYYQEKQNSFGSFVNTPYLIATDRNTNKTIKIPLREGKGKVFVDFNTERPKTKEDVKKFEDAYAVVGKKTKNQETGKEDITLDPLIENQYNTTTDRGGLIPTQADKTTSASDRPTSHPNYPERLQQPTTTPTSTPTTPKPTATAKPPVTNTPPAPDTPGTPTTPLYNPQHNTEYIGLNRPRFDSNQMYMVNGVNASLMPERFGGTSGFSTPQVKGSVLNAIYDGKVEVARDQYGNDAYMTSDGEYIHKDMYNKVAEYFNLENEAESNPDRYRGLANPKFSNPITPTTPTSNNSLNLNTNSSRRVPGSLPTTSQNTQNTLATPQNTSTNMTGLTGFIPNSWYKPGEGLTGYKPSSLASVSLSDEDFEQRKKLLFGDEYNSNQGYQGTFINQDSNGQTTFKPTGTNYVPPVAGNFTSPSLLNPEKTTPGMYTQTLGTGNNSNGSNGSNNSNIIPVINTGSGNNYDPNGWTSPKGLEAISNGLATVGGLIDSYVGYENHELAKKQFGLEKAYANRNIANQAKIINNQVGGNAKVSGYSGTYGGMSQADAAQHISSTMAKAEDRKVDGSKL
jgi:hypothetical protein